MIISAGCSAEWCDSRHNLATLAAFRHSGNTSHSDVTSQTSRFADIPAILEYPIGFRGRSNALAKSVLAAKLCLISAQPATLCCFNTAASELECSCLSAKLCRFWRPFYAESDKFTGARVLLKKACIFGLSSAMMRQSWFGFRPLGT